MRGVLFRLFTRPSIVWDLLVMAVLMRILSVVCGGVEEILFVDSEAGEHIYEAGDALRIHLALLAGVVIGVVSNFALQDLAYCRSTWTLPGLGPGLRRELVQLAGATTLLSGLSFAIFDGHLSIVVAPALTLLGFGLGTLIWDFHLRKGAGLVAQLGLLALLCSSRSIAGLPQSVSLLMLPIALLVSGYAIQRSTAVAGMRARALVAIADLGSSFREPATVAPYKASALERTRGWTRGRIVGAGGWAHALLFEHAGWARGSWAGSASRMTAGVAVITLALVFGLGVRHAGSVNDGLAWVAQSVIDPRLKLAGVTFHTPEFIMSMGFATASFMVILGARQDLRRGTIYPLSRSDRAEVVWRAGLAQGLIAVLAPALVLLMIGVVCLLASGVVLPIRRMPEIFSALAVTAALVPLLQWARLRFLENAHEAWSPTAYGAIVGIAAAVFTGSHAMILTQLRRTEAVTAFVLTLIILPALYMTVQWLFRAWIRHWYERADLA